MTDDKKAAEELIETLEDGERGVEVGHAYGDDVDESGSAEVETVT